MLQKLSIEVRNLDVGPIKDGLFLKQQIKTTSKFGIGDGLFAAPPRSFNCRTEQFGFEKLIQPSILIVYKDGKTQRKSNCRSQTL